MNLEPLHQWLRDACISERGPVTVIGMMEELAGLRRGPEPERYADLPTDGISLHQMLEKLEAAGMAKRDGSWWMWVEKAEAKPKEQPAKQGALFS